MFNEFLRRLRCGVWIAVVWAWAGCVCAKTLELTQAWMEVQTAQGASEKQVQLPFSWDNDHPGQAGEARFVLRWSLEQIPPDGVALYLPKVGNRFEISVNGHVLANQLATAAGSAQERHEKAKLDLNKKPHWIAVPTAILGRENVLVIRIEADALRKGGLGTVSVGPATALFTRYEHSYLWQVSWAMAVIAFNWTVAAFSLILWFTRAEKGARGRLYLMAALTEFFWSIRMLDLLLTTPPMGWAWWNMVNSLAYVFWIYGALLFVHHIADIPGQWIERAGFGMLVLGVASAAAYSFAAQPLPWVVWLGTVAVSLLTYGGWFCFRALRQPSLERLLIAVTVMVNVCAGAHDWWFVRVSGATSGHVPWMPYSTVLFGWSLMFVVIVRYKKSILRERDAVDNLERRVSEKEMTLMQSYEEQKLHLVQSERLTERQRVLRDMHDGVGAHLSAAIRQLEQGRYQTADLLWTLRDSLDLLKLTVDGMNSEPGDAVGLLANMRYRLDARMRSAGLALVWRIDSDVRPLAWMTLQDMQHLRYMIFGVFSNILQHAQASQLEVMARIEGAHCVFEFCDNGMGFDPLQTSMRGLRFLKERAQLMGGHLDITSRPGRTCVLLRLPLFK